MDKTLVVHVERHKTSKIEKNFHISIRLYIDI